ncbi:MAG: radical SAM protein [Syntrophorhabdus sp.]|nr:radical SAM protein [Syntrophorhabdus sp.]
MTDFPSYVRLHEEGVLGDRLEQILGLASPCMLCPRQCMVDRTTGDRGYCQAPYGLYVSSASPHFGEEGPLVGTGGSGTIFMTHCNLRCVFCQNHDISIRGEGVSCSAAALADVMTDLQRKGCHNINLVTPTHYVHQIVRALPSAIEKGLTIPLVYNSGGYDSPEVLRFLDGIFDIYMPDIKFLDTALAARYCHAEDYPSVVWKAVKEMHRQVGDLVVDERGIARRGLIIRHLVMPGAAADTRKVLERIGAELSPDSYVNIMAQYYPCHRASEFPEISRRISMEEFEDAVRYGRSIGLTRASRH